MMRGHISQSDDLLLGCGKDLSSVGGGGTKSAFRHKGHLDEILRFGKRAKVTTSETAAFGIRFTVAFFFWLAACRKLRRECFGHSHIYLPCLCLFLVLV